MLANQQPMKEPPRRPWTPPRIKGDPLLDAALHRRRFWARRATTTDWWKIHPDYSDALFALCARLAVNTYLKTWDSPVNPHAVERRVEFLDGGVEKYCGGFFIGRQGTWVFGRNALRLILYEIGFPQPRRRKDELRVPAHEELLKQLEAQRPGHIESKADLAGREYDEYFRHSLILEQALDLRAYSEPAPHSERDAALIELLRLDRAGHGRTAPARELRASLWPDSSHPLRRTEVRLARHFHVA